MSNVTDLGEYRDRGLTRRQRLVAERYRTGRYEHCGLCTDLGCVSAATGEGVPCMACGRVGVLPVEERPLEVVLDELADAFTPAN